ncbi:MAG: hypothetical protein ACXVW6_06740 [Nocardioidaceae bacterium]
MNIDFNQDPLFSTYVVLLILSGVAMMLMAGLLRTGTGLRLLNGLFGLGFFGYGIYLGFIFAGGSYLIFFKAFILPVVLVFRTAQSVAARRAESERPAPAAPVAPAAPGEAQ